MTPCYCCATPLYCGCKSCVERNKDKYCWIINDDDTETCSVCGYTAHYNEWMDLEYELYMRFRQD